MMIIDFHTHIYPPAVAERAMSAVEDLLPPVTDGTSAGLLESMNRAGIDRSVALTLVNNPAKSESINRWALGERSSRITPLGSFHPAEPDPIGTIDRIAELGFPGIKVHPEYQDFRFSDARLYPFWKRCEEHGLFLITHAGFDIKFPPPFRSNPSELAAFHRALPNLRLVLAHMGSMEMWDEVEQELLGQDVWMDLAMIGYFNFTPERLASMIRRHGVEKVLFGTDSPWLDQKQSVDFVRSLPLSSSELEMIFAGNALELLG